MTVIGFIPVNLTVINQEPTIELHSISFKFHNDRAAIDHRLLFIRLLTTGGVRHAKSMLITEGGESIGVFRLALCFVLAPTRCMSKSESC